MRYRLIGVVCFVASYFTIAAFADLRQEICHFYWSSPGRLNILVGLLKESPGSEDGAGIKGMPRGRGGAGRDFLGA
jgi:hypothetical protein